MTSQGYPTLEKYSSQRGVTLVELMVAMVISLIVLLAVGTVYFSTKRTYSVQDQFSKMQENALYAFQTLTQDASSAGFAGCAQNLTSLLDTSSVNPSLYDFRLGVYGWEFKNTDPGKSYTILSLTPSGNAADWNNYETKPLDANIAKYAIPGSDVFVIISMQEQNVSPSADILPSTSKFGLSKAPPNVIPAGKIMLVSDCSQADVFMNAAKTGPSVTNPSLAKGSTTNNWSHQFKAKETRIYASTSRAYFIGQGVNGEPALFRYDLDQGAAGTPQELVDGVENMQVLYGEDVNGDMFSANSYVPIDKVKDPHKVYAVRISLLMRTGVVDRPIPANVLNEYVGAIQATAVNVHPEKDSRLRKVFTTTIALRNMAITGR